MPAAVALSAVAVSCLPSLGSITMTLTFLLISVSTAAICWAMSLVGLTGSNVTSSYWAAWALALLAMAAIQPWSAAGAEKPMVTCLPFAALSPAATATFAVLASSSLELLVQAASAATDRAPPPRRKPRRPREDGVSCGSVMTRSLFERGCAEGAVRKGCARTGVTG